MTIIQIDKITVARSQIDAAIKLFLEDADPVAVGTLLHPAWHILRDLLQHKGIQSSRDLMAEDQLKKTEHQHLTKRDIWKILDEYWNFLHHARNDPDANLDFNADYIEPTLFWVIDDFSNLAPQSHLMNVFQLWFLVRHPQEFSTYEPYALACGFFPDLLSRSLKEQKDFAVAFAQETFSHYKG